MIWRHANVHDRQIRPELAHESHQLRSVTGLADDLVPAALEQAREALPHQHVILGDDDSCHALDLGHLEIIPVTAPPGKYRSPGVGNPRRLSDGGPNVSAQAPMHGAMLAV